MKNSRTLLARLHRAALAGADPEIAVRNTLGRKEIALALRGARSIGVFAAGKAAAGMARGARGLHAARTLVVLPEGYPCAGLSRREVLRASHPEPSASSLAAARRAVGFFRSFGAGDVIVCLVSGGASSLLALPRKGVTLAAKKRAVDALARSGASILEINRLRTSLSAVKGGKLGRSTRARLVTLVLSDVPGDRAATVGSGPTVRGRGSDIVRIVGSNRSALEAAAGEARRLGLSVRRWKARLSGEARRVGRRLAREALRLPPLTVLLAGGETVVTLGAARGRGGRCLELALGAAIELDGSDGVALLAAGSDGKDGSSDAAGAFADGRTLARARRRRLDAAGTLARHDAHHFFARLGDLFGEGPTGTNVGDWVLSLRASNRSRGRALRRGLASLLFAVVAAAAGAQEPAPLHYRIRAAGSEVRWELPATLHTVRGKAPQLEGAVDAEPAPGGKWKITGRVAVAAAAMETGNRSRDRKMREKILEVGRFPEIVFETTWIAADLSPLRRGQRFTVEVTGDLTIHGRTRSVRLPVDVEPAGGLVLLSGTFGVNWREYGLADPSFGVIQVREAMKVVFRLEAEPVGTAP